MTVQEWDESMQAINAAIESGDIERSSRTKLVQFNTWLCHSNAEMHFSKNYVQVCETVRLHLLRSMIDAFEERSRKMEFWVMALAVAALISSVVQIFSPVLFREKSTASQQQAQAVQSEAPSSAAPPSSRPAKTEIEKYAPTKP